MIRKICLLIASLMLVAPALAFIVSHANPAHHMASPTLPQQPKMAGNPSPSTLFGFPGLTLDSLPWYLAIIWCTNMPFMLIAVFVAHRRRKPNRKSYWWKASLCGFCLPAVFILIAIAAKKPKVVAEDRHQDIKKIGEFI